MCLISTGTEFAGHANSDVMKPIAAPIVGGMITSTIHVLILVPVFFVMMKERALKHGTLGFGSDADFSGADS